MSPRKPEMLLLLYLFLPIKTASIGQILLCQIRSIQATRAAEQKFDLDLENNTHEGLKDLLRSLWFDRFNPAAYTYLELLAPQLGLFDYAITKIREKIAHNKFEFSNLALTQSIVDRIQVNEIKEVIANGKIIKEYFEGKKDMSGYLIDGSTQLDRPMRIKCSYFTRSMIKIVALSKVDIELENDRFVTEENTQNE
jgi:hypothetical protein